MKRETAMLELARVAAASDESFVFMGVDTAATSDRTVMRPVVMKGGLVSILKEDAELDPGLVARMTQELMAMVDRDSRRHAVAATASSTYGPEVKVAIDDLLKVWKEAKPTEAAMAAEAGAPWEKPAPIKEAYNLGRSALDLSMRRDFSTRSRGRGLAKFGDEARWWTWERLERELRLADEMEGNEAWVEDRVGMFEVCEQKGLRTED